MRRAFGPDDRVFRLADGRNLGYAEYGDPAGDPVVSCHGGLSSRLDAARAHPYAVEAGVRLLAPDRPGVGLSDRRPGRRLLDWPADVAQLAGALGVDGFAVMGWSLGGEYAAACGYALPDRVRAVGLLASGIPRDWPGMTDEINAMDRRFMRLAAVAPAAERAAFRAMGEFAARFPRRFTRVAARDLGPDAQRTLIGATADDFAAAVTEGLSNPRGAVDEYRVMNSPWGFDPADITVPVHLWQGDADVLVPPNWASRLAARIPGGTVTLYPGEGHLLAAHHYAEVFAALGGR